ncbi:MAG: alpha-glucosidase, partial [Treponema sp.]|nr:alpha-glucosidase [Treponema sp.]
MIEKYSFGQNIETDAVVNKMTSLPCDQFSLGRVKSCWPFEWEYELEKDAVVFGLGENMRGMNKRGFSYTSFCSDVPNQDESTHSMYGAHNFLIVFSRIKTFGLFFDTASEITFDIDWTKNGVMNVSTKDTGLDLYAIYADDGRKESLLDNITRQFRNLVGQSYIPPKWAFGFQQSRWGYKTEEDIREVAKRHREDSLPLDMICLDIDYMEDYKDFTVDKKKFPDLKKLSDDLKKDGIRLVPII